MTPKVDPLSRLAEAAGVFSVFEDMQGVRHNTGADTQRAMLRANGFKVSSAREVAESFAAFEQHNREAYATPDIVVSAGVSQRISVRADVTWTLQAEGAEKVLAQGRSAGKVDLPALLVGYYVLHMEGPAGQQSAFVIATPERAPMVTDTVKGGMSWGVVAALYGLYNAPSKGLGDYIDLGELAAVLGGRGAGFLGINPVHALGWAAEETISPYSPTHRGFLNTDHIAVPGFSASATGAAGGLLDYCGYRRPHRTALRAAFGRFMADATAAERQDFEAFKTAGGSRLSSFCLYEAISETQGPDWRQWSETKCLGDDAPTGVDPEAITFHSWLQWQADRQLGAAQQTAKDSGMPFGLYLDLAVGARLGGAETWGAEAATAKGISLGAPPDHLSPAGQNWQLAAMSPRKLQETRYSALRHILRQSMRHCGILRVDHALGLNRSFWIPDDGSPGGYIRQPFKTLSAIIAVEAHLTDTVVIGEDLGLVPPGFRDQLAQQGFYGYSVLQYEKDAAGDFLPVSGLRAQSLACFGTHDTPTFRGYWTGHDIDWWHKLGWVGDGDLKQAKGARAAEKKQLTALYAPANRDVATLRDAMHNTLAQAPSALVAVQLDDILDTTEAQNLPGTVDEHPNWRRRAALSIPQIARCDALDKTSDIMAGAGRSAGTRKDRR